MGIHQAHTVGTPDSGTTGTTDLNQSILQIASTLTTFSEPGRLDHDGLYAALDTFGNGVLNPGRRNKNNGKVDRIGNILNRRITPVPVNLFVTWINRVYGPLVALLEIEKDRITTFELIRRGTNQCDTTRLEEFFQSITCQFSG